MGKYTLNYETLGSNFLKTLSPNCAEDERRNAFVAFLIEALPDLWCDSYLGMPNGRVDIVQLTDDGYEFLFDLGSERVVAAFGVTRYNPAKRDSSRMSGFLGKVSSERKLDELAEKAPSPETAKRRRHLAGLSFRDQFFETHGDRYDRGHFMSHRQGGGLDINLFPQRADINQGRSTQGKSYRAMERACVANPGTFCFSRPIYDDKTWVPAELDYGALYGPGTMDVRTFPNK